MVVFPAPLMSTIHELGAFLNREAAAVATPAATPTGQASTLNPKLNDRKLNGEGRPAAGRRAASSETGGVTP
jgi:hypothetical protein